MQEGQDGAQDAAGEGVAFGRRRSRGGRRWRRDEGAFFDKAHQRARQGFDGLFKEAVRLFGREAREGCTSDIRQLVAETRYQLRHTFAIQSSEVYKPGGSLSRVPQSVRAVVVVVVLLVWWSQGFQLLLDGHDDFPRARVLPHEVEASPKCVFVLIERWQTVVGESEERDERIEEGEGIVEERFLRKSEVNGARCAVVEGLGRTSTWRLPWMMRWSSFSS